MTLQLIHTTTGNAVIKGETVTDSRGEQFIVTSWREPQHSGSTGRVYVRHIGSASSAVWGLFPTVFRMKFVEAEEIGKA